MYGIMPFGVKFTEYSRNTLPIYSACQPWVALMNRNSQHGPDEFKLSVAPPLWTVSSLLQLHFW